MGKPVKQYVVGGFEVDSKLESQLAAYEQFPENRLKFDDSGRRQGNIIVTADGEHDPRDAHTNFDRRIRHYLIGTNPVVLETTEEVALGREHSLRILAEIFDRPHARSVREIVGRMRKLSDAQADRLRSALLELKSEVR
ncbi:hypothetical protein [Burkholderia gladioli]|nr:hypothetical protein [Burkholderia gladioli]AWY54618.1 hypothetical protein A8H28_26225 [Burkholderia gladioli pv. gladioli]